MTSPLTIIILAAGLGTRMRSRKVKVLHHAGGKALVEHAVDTALQLTEPASVVVVVGHQADEVEALLGPRGVRFVRQTEQKGTGHAVLCCESAVAERSGRVVVTYGDGPLLRMETVRSLIELQRTQNVSATAITTHLDNPRGYGRVIRDSEGAMLAVVEEKPATEEQRRIREVNAGIYCFDAELLWRHLHDIRPDNPPQEYYLTDMVEILNRAGHRVLPLVVTDSTELLGINTRVELAEVDRILRDRKVHELMLAGVTIERPETVTIDGSVKVGQDTIIEPFTRILGATEIGDECHIGAHSIIESSHLADQVHILPYTLVVRSQLDQGARVGPFARLRFDNHVEAGAMIGNFVELKKARIGKNAKAQHLAYLGDSVIGAGANIGAGTITCNYDGRHKHQTNIGAGAFVGSNSTLVAPLEVGDGSYIAAGSVITGAVPTDALAIARGRQANKEGWAKRRREVR